MWCKTLFIISILLIPVMAGAQTKTELAGNSLTEYPFFEYVKAFNVNATIEVAVDPNLYPGIVGLTCNIYIVNSKTATEWSVDPLLVDVTAGGFSTQTFSAGPIQINTFLVAGPSELSADAGIGLGVGYDVVIDTNRNGQLDAGDYIDGYDDNEAGLYVVHDVTQAGPLAVTEVSSYSVGTVFGIPVGFTNEDLYYPTNIASMGKLPLVVVSHGNGHNYQWYDHIGFHLASYGYIVMSHQNNTVPGIETCSSTTLGHTDAIIDQQGTISGGVLNGHLDSDKIVWIGHSRGAEGVARGFDRIFDGTYVPTHYGTANIKLISSMLPTDFLGTNNSDPHNANYHLWTASGDADVSGTAANDIAQTFHLHDRATNYRHSTIVQGAGHAWFHNGGGSSVFTGPCPIGQANTHLIQQGMFLCLVKYYIEHNIPAEEFFWRQYEHIHPIGVPEGTDPCIVVTNTYHNGDDAGNFVIDNYQTETSTSVSSSVGAVTYTVQNLTEGRLDDNNSDFLWTSSDPFNGATLARATDTTRGVTFDWTGSDLYYEWEIIASRKDFTGYKYLSFRAAQGTQHPNTLAVLGDLTFSVTLRDSSLKTSTINIGAYGGGLEQPYQRSGGWHDEFETIRIRLTDFLINRSGLDLSNIVAVRFDCGPTYGSNEGRIALDDMELTKDIPPYPYPSPTPTSTPTISPTNTPLLTNTPTATYTPTDTPTSTNTPTRTPTSVPTSTNTPTRTPTSVPTSTNTPTRTPTSVPTSTNTPTRTPTNTPRPTNTPTLTPSNTPTSTLTPTLLPIPVNGPTGSGLLLVIVSLVILVGYQGFSRTFFSSSNKTSQKRLNVLRNIVLSICVIVVTTTVIAGEPPVPATPASVDDILYIRQFTLEQGYTHLWSLDKPLVTSGYLIVIRINPDLVTPRQMLEPVLYAGYQTAQRINSGYESGMVVALVPGSLNFMKEPIWFGTPELPERVSAGIISKEHIMAEKAGIQPFSAKKIEAAVEKGGTPLHLTDIDKLFRGVIADLILTYSPQEKQLAEDFRVTRANAQ